MSKSKNTTSEVPDVPKHQPLTPEETEQQKLHLAQYSMEAEDYTKSNPDDTLGTIDNPTFPPAVPEITGKPEPQVEGNDDSLEFNEEDTEDFDIPDFSDDEELESENPNGPFGFEFALHALKNEQLIRRHGWSGRHLELMDGVIRDIRTSDTSEFNYQPNHTELLAEDWVIIQEEV